MRLLLPKTHVIPPAGFSDVKPLLINMNNVVHVMEAVEGGVDVEVRILDPRFHVFLRQVGL